MHALAQVLLHSGACTQTRAVFHDVCYERDAPPLTLRPSAAAHEQQQQRASSASQRGCLFVLCCEAITSSALTVTSAVDDVALTLRPSRRDVGTTRVLLSPTSPPVATAQTTTTTAVSRAETSVFGASNNNSFCGDKIDVDEAATTTRRQHAAPLQQHHGTTVHTSSPSPSSTLSSPHELPHLTLDATAAAAARQRRRVTRSCCFVVWASYTYIQQHLPQHFPCAVHAQRVRCEPCLRTRKAATATIAATAAKARTASATAASLAAQGGALVLLPGCHILGVAVTALSPGTDCAAAYNNNNSAHVGDSDRQASWPPPHLQQSQQQQSYALRHRSGRRERSTPRPLTRVTVRSMVVDTTAAEADAHAAAGEVLTVAQHSFVFVRGGAVRFVEALKAIRPALAQHVDCVVSLSPGTSNDYRSNQEEEDDEDDDDEEDNIDAQQQQQRDGNSRDAVMAATALSSPPPLPRRALHSPRSPPSTAHTQSPAQPRDDVKDVEPDTTHTPRRRQAQQEQQPQQQQLQQRRRQWLSQQQPSLRNSRHAPLHALWGRVRSSVAAANVATSTVLRAFFDKDDDAANDEDDDDAHDAEMHTRQQGDDEGNSGTGSADGGATRASTMPSPVLPPAPSSSSLTWLPSSSGVPRPLTAAQWARCFVHEDATAAALSTVHDDGEYAVRAQTAATTTMRCDGDTSKRRVAAGVDSSSGSVTAAGNAVEGVSTRVKQQQHNNNNNNNSISDGVAAVYTTGARTAALLHRRHAVHSTRSNSSSSSNTTAVAAAVVVKEAELLRAREVAFWCGGIDADIRLEVWCYLLDVHCASPCHTTTRTTAVTAAACTCADEDSDMCNNNNNNACDTATAAAGTLSCPHCAHKALYTTLRTQWQSLLPVQVAHFASYAERQAAVDKDVRRTNRGDAVFRDDASPALRTLRHVLMAYVMYDFDHGYWQGMSDIAAVLVALCNDNNNNNNNGDNKSTSDTDDDDADECESLAFALFRSLLSRHMSSCFSADVQHGMPHRLRQVRVLVRHFCPVLYAHLQRLHADDMMLCFRWLLTMYKRDVASLEEVMRMWDVLLACPYTRHYDVFVAVALLRALSPYMCAHLHTATAVLRYANNLSARVRVADMLAHAHAFYDEVCAEYTLMVDALGGAVAADTSTAVTTNTTSSTRTSATLLSPQVTLQLRRPTLEAVVDLLLVVDGDLPTL